MALVFVRIFTGFGAAILAAAFLGYSPLPHEIDPEGIIFALIPFVFSAISSPTVILTILMFQGEAISDAHRHGLPDPPVLWATLRALGVSLAFYSPWIEAAIRKPSAGDEAAKLEKD